VGLEVFKGEAGVSFTTQFVGGTVGDVTLKVACVPRFKAACREYIFVEGMEFSCVRWREFFRALEPDAASVRVVRR
jgi:hypothetical protein